MDLCRQSDVSALWYTVYVCHSFRSLVAQLVKNLPAMWETWVRILGWEDPLEKGTATYCSILAWRIHKESDSTERLSLSLFLPRSKRLLISQLQSLSTVIFLAQENKICHCFHFFPIRLPWSDRTIPYHISWLLPKFLSHEIVRHNAVVVVLNWNPLFFSEKLGLASTLFTLPSNTTFVMSWMQCMV